MSDKEKNLSEAISQIEKQFGKGTVMKMGDREIVDIPSVSTGSIGLDIALGIGGLPKGRVVEIFGPESSGKTTLTLQAIAECQKAGGTAAFIDAEHALDPNYAEKLGVNVEESFLPEYVETDRGKKIIKELKINLLFGSGCRPFMERPKTPSIRPYYKTGRPKYVTCFKPVGNISFT